MAKKGLYAIEPVVKAKKVANRNPVGGPNVSNIVSPTVPEKPATLNGLGPVAHTFPAHHVKGSHGFGHLGHQKAGHLRLSGLTNAHQIGGANKPPKNPKLG